MRVSRCLEARRDPTGNLLVYYRDRHGDNVIGSSSRYVAALSAKMPWMRWSANTPGWPGVKKHVTCHLWRHTCATHLLKNQANLRHVQEILGHRSLATTERYLHLRDQGVVSCHLSFGLRPAV